MASTSWECWTNCSSAWRAIGEDSTCWEYIYDGFIDSTRLTVSVIDIRVDQDYDPLEEEQPEHECDIIVKIYERYTDDPVFETLVYENVDTITSSSSKMYYKHIQWAIDLLEVRENPSEANIRIRHKELCPDCSHPYVCDCEDIISVGNTTYTITGSAAGNPASETMYVELLEVAMDYQSVYVNIKIYTDNGLLKYDNTDVIQINNYIDISDNVLVHDWRVNYITISSSGVKFQLCYSYIDSGEGSGSTGEGLVVSQYFNSTTFGWTCGCLIRSKIDNPGDSAKGRNSAPTEVRLDIHEWQGAYLSTKSSPVLTTQTIITPNQEMQPDDYWMTFMWDTDLPPGEYMWVITCLRGPHDGSFRLIYIDHEDYQRDQAFVNGYPHRDFWSKIVGVTETESYQKVISRNDSFNNIYACTPGHPKIKAKISDGSYKGVGTTEKGNNYIAYKQCYMSVGGNNLSFEEPDFAGWRVSEGGETSIVQSLDTYGTFPTDGVTSAKMTAPAYDNGYAKLYQHMVFTNCATAHTITFDYCVMESTVYGPSFPPLLFTVYVGSTVKIRDRVWSVGTRTRSIPNFTSGTLIFELTALYGGLPRSLYIDNIRMTGGSDYDMSPLGRIAGGSVIDV